MNVKRIQDPHRSEWESLIKRPAFETAHLDQIVETVMKNVLEQGDEALIAYSERFDKVKLASLAVSREEIDNSGHEIALPLKDAIELAYRNILKFHEQQREEVIKLETTQGVSCWRKSLPIEKVGLYVPGGSAPLFSTLLMLAVPAKLAGCREIVVCTPPGPEGKVSPAIRYAAKTVGINNMFRVGGVQAIAAMAHGTPSIPKVYKIFGPGNQYVTHAKHYVARKGTAIDMPAGPSELLVIADESAVAGFVAADLLSQAEHGPDSQVVLVSISTNFETQVLKELEKQLSGLPRAEIAKKALKNSTFITFDSLEKGVDFSNHYAPEHLIIASEDPEPIADRIINAGSVFLGNWTPESVGDYASGTNHSLPTSGYAKVTGGVSLDSFLKKVTFQKLSKQGIKNIGLAVETMAEAEGLDAHKLAVSVRLKSIGDE